MAQQLRESTKRPESIVPCPMCHFGYAVDPNGASDGECMLCTSGWVDVNATCVCGLPAVYAGLVDGKKFKYCGRAACNKVPEPPKVEEKRFGQYARNGFTAFCGLGGH